MKLQNPNNKYYKRALQIEINLGNEGNSAPEKYPPTIDLHPKIIKYRNLKITGKENDELFYWIDSLFKDKHPLENGLTLGSGTGKEATYMQNKGFVKKWDSIDIVETKGNQLKEGIDNTFTCFDLNFVNLPNNKYDIVICFAMLHHIINMEELLFEVNKTLKDDGLLLVYEYVGESKWNFSSLKKEMIKKSLEEKFNTTFIFHKRDMSLRPLESIRSVEIPSLFNIYFDKCKIFEYLWNPILYSGINIASQIKNKPNDSDFIDKQIQLLIELNELNENNENLIKTEFVGLYKKNKDLTKPIYTKPWTNKEIKTNLNSFGYTKTKLISKLRQCLPEFIFKYYRRIYGKR